MGCVEKRSISVMLMRQKLQDLVSDCMWLMGKNGKTMKISEFLVEMTGWVGGDIPWDRRK